MKKIFIVTYGGGHVNIIIKLYYHLIKIFHVNILALNTACEALDRANIPYNRLYHYVCKMKNKEEIIKIGKRFIDDNNIDCSKIGELDSIIYYGCNVKDYISNFGEKDLNYLYSIYGRSIFLPIKTIDEIINIECPDAILTTNSPRFERAALLVGRRNKIDTFSIEDLYGTSRLLSPKDSNKTYWGDYIFVINRVAENNLKTKNLDVKKIFITGQPCFDVEFNKNEKVEGKNKIVLWASQNTNDKDIILEDLLKAFSKIKDKILIIKPHPNDNYFHIQKRIKNHRNVYIAQEGNIEEMIEKSDALVTEFSTCGINAILMNKPLLVINIKNRELPLDYCKMNLALKVDNINDIDDKLNLFFNKDELVFEILNNVKNFKMPKNAAQNITNIIHDIVNKGIISEDNFERS